MRVICHLCGSQQIFDPCNFRCACGGPWEPLENSSFDASLIDRAEYNVWRYAGFFNLEEGPEPFTLGAGWTPLVEGDYAGAPVHFKLEFISPTGSFKDRGTEVEVNYLQTAGIRAVVEDSSGNAGASLAAYVARAGIHAAIYAPEHASPAKRFQIAIYGAELRLISGPRSQTTRAVLEAVAAGSVYASHAWNPVYLLGQQSIAWELWEQMGGGVPDALIIPSGQGGLLLGAWLGFKRLLNSGMIARMPRLFAAQPEVLSPIACAFSQGREDVPAVEPRGQSAAEGLAIVKPVRGRRILQALRESGGGAVTVSEDEIMQAYRRLAIQGLFVEPSSAVAAAALPTVREIIGPEMQIVVPLTGSGLKSMAEEL